MPPVSDIDGTLVHYPTPAQFSEVRICRPFGMLQTLVVLYLRQLRFTLRCFLTS